MLGSAATLTVLPAQLGYFWAALSGAAAAAVVGAAAALVGAAAAVVGAAAGAWVAVTGVPLACCCKGAPGAFPPPQALTSKTATAVAESIQPDRAIVMRLLTL